MADISASIGTSLATDLFGSISYPFRVRLAGRSLDEESEDAAPESAASVEWLSSEEGDEDPPEFEADLEALLDLTVDTYLDELTDRYGGRNEDAEATALVKPYAEGVSSGTTRSVRNAAIATIKTRMAADTQFGAKLETFVKARSSVSIVWVEIEVTSMPSAQMGNPIVLGALRLGIRAKVKACVKVFGKERCISITSPWVRVEGRRAALYLEAAGLKVRGRGHVNDIDIVIKFKILGKEFKIKVGITGFVNDQLANQRPVLADLTDVKLTIPGIGKTFKPVTVAAPANGSDTILEIDGGFS